MSYHIYTTNGIILKRSPSKEANVVVHVLTQDLGLILASAQAARGASSKLRPGLQEYAEVTLSCIQGKNGWKITNVVSQSNYFFDMPEDSRRVLAQVCSVLVQMIPGEDPNKEVFETVSSGLHFLKSVSKEELPFFEILMMLRILFELGYVARNEETEEFLSTREWKQSDFVRVQEKREKLLSLINKALKESQL